MDSFDEIGHKFVSSVLKGEKLPLSNRVFRDLFTVNLKNIEYFAHNPLKAVVVVNGFIAFCVLPLLILDYFKPISGRSPAHKKTDIRDKKSSP